MNLDSLRQHWDRFGRKDPFWANLSLPAKRNGQWAVNEFFKHGQIEIGLVLDHARTLGFNLRLDRALDFGCGIGRLTQALGAHFGRCDGVDIAPSMLDLAARFNRYPEKCRYHLNPSDDLKLFEDGAFTFVYSTLVLQHLRPELSKGYIREFLRVLAPSGLLVFQLPSHRFPEEPPEGSLRTVCTRPLPDSAFRARIVPSQPSIVAPAGEIATLQVNVRNVSDCMWPSLGGPDSERQINLGNRWLKADGSVLFPDDSRSELPFDLAPQESADLFLELHLPLEPGDYLVELDMVQEEVAWFKDKGSDPVRIGCRAEPNPGVARSLQARAVPQHKARSSGPRPLGARYPRLREWSRRVGILMLYRTARRGSAVLRSWWRKTRRARLPMMEMHSVPRREVADLIAECGGTLLDTETQLLPGGWQSCRYWVTR